jgi:hypothetical protein
VEDQQSFQLPPPDADIQLRRPPVATLIAPGQPRVRGRALLRDTTEIRLSDLLQQRNQHIAFQAGLLDLTFVEK